MTRNNKAGKGDDFLEGHIASEHLGHAHHGHAHQGAMSPTVGLPITCPTLILCAGTTPAPGCCWTVLATTDCTTTRENGATCCWRLLATTDCTSTRDGAACCWLLLHSTDCTMVAGRDDSDC